MGCVNLVDLFALSRPVVSMNVIGFWKGWRTAADVQMDDVACQWVSKSTLGWEA
jgi:hypothetical protein